MNLKDTRLPRRRVAVQRHTPSAPRAMGMPRGDQPSQEPVRHTVAAVGEEKVKVMGAVEVGEGEPGEDM